MVAVPGKKVGKHDWLYNIVDLIASEYGWTKEYIFNNVYPREIKTFDVMITRRQFNNYRMLLAISSNPHTKDPKKFANLINRQVGNLDTDDTNTFDQVGIQALKKKIATTSKQIKVTNGI